MPVVDSTTLKGYFNDSDAPGESQYIDLIDTIFSMGGILSSGNAFPANPTTGQIFFRTDLGLLCYYTGSIWLTANEYSIPNPWVSTTIVSQQWFNKVRTNFAPYFTRFSFTVNVNSANNGNDPSNYWTVTIRSSTSTFSAYTTIRTFNTSQMTVNTWTLNEGTASNASPSNYGNYDVYLTKTGSPGVFQGIGVTYYRAIIT